jgi:hypothetical protein
MTFISRPHVALCSDKTRINMGVRARVNIRKAEAYYPFARSPRLEPKHETFIHTILPASLPPIGTLEVIFGSR